jgi:hypothetical protein
MEKTQKETITPCATDPRSGAFLTSGPGIRNKLLPEPGARIQDLNPIFKKVK